MKIISFHYISLDFDWLIDECRKQTWLLIHFSLSLSQFISLSHLSGMIDWLEIGMRLDWEWKSTPSWKETKPNQNHSFFQFHWLIDWIEIWFCFEIEIETLWRWICWKWKVWQISFHHSFILMIDWLIDEIC